MDSASPHEPVELDGVPQEEDVSAADAADRVDHDPEAEANRSDPDADVLRAAATGIADSSDPEDS